MPTWGKRILVKIELRDTSVVGKRFESVKEREEAQVAAIAEILDMKNVDKVFKKHGILLTDIYLEITPDNK